MARRRVRDRRRLSDERRLLVGALERESAEQGEDWEDNLDQIAIEEAELKARGLTRIVAAPGSIATIPPTPPIGARTQPA